MEKLVVDLLQREHLREAVGLWQAENAEPALVSAVENFVYFFEREGRQLVLRLTHSSHRSTAQVSGELDWIDYLYGRGVRVCRPLRSGAGRLTEILPAGDSYFVATVFEPAPGRRVSREDADVWNAALFRRWGQTIGRMHVATREYQVSDPAIKRAEWDEEELLVNAPRYLPKSEDQVLNALAESIIWLQSLSRDRDSYGLIHTDLHHGNFHADASGITVFDFDDCAYHWYIYDLAVPLYYVLLGIPRDQGERRAELTREFFAPLREGYIEESALPPFWWDQLPRFMRLRDLILYVFCHKKFDLDNLTDQQAGLIGRLRANLTADPPYPIPE